MAMKRWWIQNLNRSLCVFDAGEINPSLYSVTISYLLSIPVHRHLNWERGRVEGHKNN